jgi:diacylglycerol kinase
MPALISVWLAGIHPACSGLRWLVMHEANARVHLAATVAIIALGAWLLVSCGVSCRLVAAVATTEAFNRDAAAGAKLAAATATAIIGVAILKSPLRAA